jgi:trimethylamine--corrinoid protein Co-methyltransferase
MANVRSNDVSFRSAQFGLFSRLSHEQCQRIHRASLEVMGRAGVRLYEQEAIDLIRKAGASVSDGNLVHIPTRLVEHALSAAPERLVLYDRHGEPVMPVEGYNSFFGPGSDCLNIVDHRTQQRRKPVLQDVVEAATVCDALEHIDFLMSVFLPSDVDGRMADRYQMEAMLNHTTKPILFVTYDFPGWVDVVEMAEVVAGGLDALREKPFVAGYVNTTSGLRHNEDALQKLLYMAEQGLPVIFVAGTLPGVTGPVTVAGSLVMRNVGSLVGLVIAQLKREGTPFVTTGSVPSVDMRTMVQPYCGADSFGAAESVAHYYNLPIFALAGASDAKLVDQQAALETALSLVLDRLYGGQIVHDLGYLESGLCGSLAQLVICNEILDWIKHALQEVEVSDETLAVDLINEVGPDGQFLDSAHTLRHFKKRWVPRLLERENYDDWLAKGGKSLAERAAERVDEILAEHQPQRLPDDIARRVKAIVRRAEDTAGG